ncbi:MAG: hypothetical protein DI626_03520 [Micavibrio aeruginosavorus]|uniref:Uncharacterized protein n=1 Tax=Micavibrio aeruginosavorus TaxID=349221 RepID=A0A2W4ZZ98_9BACT|nr:MAG: hypothetical protein DI626_03520 [Micavibrio aeruginosavorus]
MRKYILLAASCAAVAPLFPAGVSAQEQPQEITADTAVTTEATAAPVEIKEEPAKTIIATEKKVSTSNLIDDEVLNLIRKKVNTELVFFMLKNQNTKYANYGDDKVQELDKQWVEERKADSKPLISATLTNPLSSYLTMVQAHSYGLFTTLFVMDAKGLNVGQSDISSDYWQGDEKK